MQTSTTTTLDRPVATDETDRLISSDKVVGTAVYNLQGEHLGSVYNLMVDKISGQVVYTVMSFGGFLSIGESYHPLPWRVLKYDVRQGGYVVDLDRQRLEGAPSYTASSLPNWSDRDYGRRVDEYYGVPPYGFWARHFANGHPVPDCSFGVGRGGHWTIEDLITPKLRREGMDKDRVVGAAHQIKGAVKEAVGKVIGDAKTQAEGAAQKTTGKVQNAVGGAKDAVRDSLKK
jgi:uncharacterized protein YjbJ (UPF0337 family)